MHRLIISGGHRLKGEITLSAGKNAVLPIIASCIMSKEEIVLKNCPRISDILNMLNIINSIGGTAYYDGESIVVNCRDANPQNVEESLTKCIRSSVFVLGPILARFRRASISYPGGCAIGKRPIDLHILGLKSLNVKITEGEESIVCEGKGIRGGKVDLSFPSVGATENIMMAAVLTEGTTTINNAAREPEIVDLANFINAIGGRVSGQGSDTIVIEGVRKLGGCEYTPITDRIVGGTILAACAAAGGQVSVRNFDRNNTESLIEILIKSGCEIMCKEDCITIESRGRLRAVSKIATKPFPYFPTDMQAQVMSMLSLAEGESQIEENLFENRFRHVSELRKMGALISVEGSKATISGVNSLVGAEVEAMDLRGGAALVIAGLAARGITTINNTHHIDRGYESIEKTFRALGAQIRREVFL